MTSITQRRMSFIYGDKTTKWLRDETGISQRRLNRIAEGLRLPTANQRRLIRNTYQREARSVLKGAGFSAKQGDRFASYKPESVTQVRKDLTNKIDWLTEGLASQRRAALDKAGTPYDELDVFYQAREDIQQGVARSRKSYEHWQDYGTEAEFIG